MPKIHFKYPILIIFIKQTLEIYFKQGRKFKFFCQIGLKYRKIVFKYWKYILNTLKSVSKYIWFGKGRWQQCANRHSIISVKLGSFVNISPLMQPNFLFKLLLHQSLTIVIRYYMFFPKNVIKQLQRVQNAAARVVSLSPKFCHITPVLMNLHWLPIDLGIEFKILIVTYKTLHGLAPAYI